ncbi:helix-turn-helix domain-containing protein [Sphingomonas sp. DT-204]|uniref:helix-turn-helix domain-containing protein n=1 Tax=Sphingomonas sp. DT-204 TaxID=3396166 RepID=UPI003F1BC73B
MADFAHIRRTPAASLDEAMLALCRSVEAKRARTVIDHILKHGIITNEELSELYGYDHPPRAIRDVRENGIPLITHSVTSPRTGRRMGAYTFDDISRIKAGRVGGRKAFSKPFKQQLIALYGARDTITGEALDERYLQIDHRVPYEVAGDDGGPLDPQDFMLLDASSNRAKSWSCEHCDNFRAKRDPAICTTCFWASPESYSHIAETPSRRIELVWTGEEVASFERVKRQAEMRGIDLAAYIKLRLGE